MFLVLCIVVFFKIFINRLNLLFMKKLFFYSFFLLILCFVGCDNQTGSTENEYPIPDGAVGLKALTSQYNTGENMGYSNASHSFLLMFATEECEVIEGSAFGNGGVLVLELCSESADNLLPAEGIYPILDMAPIEDGMIIGGFDIAMGVPFGSYMWNMVDDEFVDWSLITGGAIEIKRGKTADELEFFMYVVFEDGREENYYYGGKLLITDMSVEF